MFIFGITKNSTYTFIHTYTYIYMHVHIHIYGKAFHINTWTNYLFLKKNMVPKDNSSSHA
jgi:hypothetical protein